MEAALATKPEAKKKTAQPAADTFSEAPAQLPEGGAPAGMPPFLVGSIRARIWRKCACGGGCASCQSAALEEEPPFLRRTGPNARDLGSVDASLIPSDSPAQSLDEHTRGSMEAHFGSDFSDVRVHSDARAAHSADALGADAYTTGRDIYFAEGKYSPGSGEGQRLLAHELTHTLQQSNGTASIATHPDGSVLVGSPTDPLEAEAERAAESLGSPTAGHPQVSQDKGPAVRRGLRSAAGAAWGAVKGAASDLWDKAKETAAAFIDRMAPGVLPLLRGAGKFLYEKITAGMDSMFNGIASRVRKRGVVGAITGLLGEIAGSIGKSVAQLASGSCHSIVEAASSIISFVKHIGGEAFAEIGRIAKEVGGFFSDVWSDYAKPALKAIEHVAGEAWTWISEKAQWLWNKILPIRNAVSSAWDWIKKEFRDRQEETAGFLDWLYDKAKAQWMKIRDKIAPVLGPLKLVAGALLLLSPLGPIILIWKGAPYLWQALKFIWANGIKPASEKIRAEFREHILPHIINGIGTITALLDQASAFLCGHASTISAGLHSLEGALGNVPFLSVASRMVGFVAGFFDDLAGKGSASSPTSWAP